MVLKEYENLTPRELELADHYSEIGDSSALRHLQKVSAERDVSQERSEAISNFQFNRRD